jgi:ABC-type nitrate/sulfonate/bicarbonate transport system substrate-binding protein
LQFKDGLVKALNNRKQNTRTRQANECGAAMKKVLILALLCWMVETAVASADDRVRITYASRSISSILAFIAADKGFFKEESLEPQLILTRGTTAIAAAAAGDVEAIHVMGSAIRGIMQGLPLKVLAVNQKLPLFYLVTRPELKSFADLKGKTMAVTTFGGSQQLAGFHMLRKGGVDPAKEITTIVSGDVPAQLQAQVSGPVHITVLSPPTVFVARDRYKLNLLASIGDDYVNFISGLIASERSLREKSGLIKRALRALAKANRYFHANENGSAEILVKYLNVSQPVALETYRYGLPAYTRNGIPTEKEIEEHLKADAQFLKLKEPVKSSAVFDFSVQREVNGEMGIK